VDGCGDIEEPVAEKFHLARCLLYIYYNITYLVYIMICYVKLYMIEPVAEKFHLARCVLYVL
jgi:hypothetical protein